jgi:O-antigen/teichoic acid export membrane protein
MTLGAGVIVISLASRAITWSVFGRRCLRSTREKFFYWLKSTLFLGVALTAWSQYQEPDASFLLLVALSFAFSAVLNMLRSQWVFMLP